MWLIHTDFFWDLPSPQSGDEARGSYLDTSYSEDILHLEPPTTMPL